MAVEADGARTVYLPQLDPLVNGRQKKKILTRPHALLLYATELAKLHLVANRSLSALHAHSCFSLNAREPMPLFTPHADLLDHVGRYELFPPLGRSAVGVWLSGQPPVARPPGEPPRCSLSPPRPGDLGATRSALRPIGRDAFARLHAEAGLRYGEGEQRGGSSGGLATLNLYDRNGESLGPSFLCQWHVVDARLQAYLDARPRIRMGS